MCVYIYIYTYLHTYTHTYIHIYIYYNNNNNNDNYNNNNDNNNNNTNDDNKGSADNKLERVASLRSRGRRHTPHCCLHFSKIIITKIINNSNNSKQEIICIYTY